MLPPATALLPDRALLIAKARREVIERAAGAEVAVRHIEPWITRSWQRCLAAGQRPQQRVAFDAVGPALARRTVDEHHDLAKAAQPVLDRLARAIADTRYFAVLTDARGIVVDVRGVPANAERAAIDIARVGVDLSERAVGTTAIGAALAELQPVWLHRGEHFFDDTSLYSCAGAPLFGPDGRCVGMLDLTGVNVVERPELKHLAALSARSIENALVLRQPHALLVRLNWPGYGGHTDAEGLICLDADGQVSASNAVAREMLYPTGAMPAAPLHASDLFAMPWTLLWDAAHRTHHPEGAVLEVPLWSGLRLQARPQRRADRAEAPLAPSSPPRLREVETALILKAVDDARGNVAEAARRLGISRATVYRKLANGGRGTRGERGGSKAR
ncbi:MAG: GAF domain-containing protein [Variovorax sp.]|nr:MAG: GAF domain-containing protein [Variovorax sp.]